ncbi:MAG: CstA-like transporter-associated (seleno)protein [Methylophilaceae bacterium]
MWLRKLKHVWHIVRQLSGDNAYECYLVHHAAFHANSVEAKPALSRKAFYQLWQETKWKEVKRCC